MWHRDGISVGEAAAFALLVPPRGSLNGDDVLLLGVGESSDAYHMSAPHPEGHGARRAMQAALRAAGLDAEAIDYINLHGTGTPSNDRSESQAVTSVFGAATPGSSTKGATGHTHLGCRGRARSGHQRHHAPQRVYARRGQHHAHRPHAHRTLSEGKPPFAGVACAEQFLRIWRHQLQSRLRPRGSLMELSAYIGGIGVLGPGLADWHETAAVLSGARTPITIAPLRTVLTAPVLLPPTERRRTGRVVKLALAVALEASSRAKIDPAGLASVFSSSGGDGHNCHEMCQALALAGRESFTRRDFSPIRCTTRRPDTGASQPGATLESRMYYAHSTPASVRALLEAMTQVVVDGESLLLVAYDTEYPEPIRSKRPVPDAFGTALVLTPDRRHAIRWRASTRRSATRSVPTPWRIRCSKPCASRFPRPRSLPLLSHARPSPKPDARCSQYLDRDERRGHRRERRTVRLNRACIRSKAASRIMGACACSMK